MLGNIIAKPPISRLEEPSGATRRRIPLFFLTQYPGNAMMRIKQRTGNVLP
jgi:hypothetical protein